MRTAFLLAFLTRSTGCVAIVSANQETEAYDRTQADTNVPAGPGASCARLPESSTPLVSLSLPAARALAAL